MDLMQASQLKQTAESCACSPAEPCPRPQQQMCAHHAVGGQLHRRLLARRALVQREQAGVHQVQLGLGRGEGLSQRMSEGAQGWHGLCLHVGDGAATGHA